MTTGGELGYCVVSKYLFGIPHTVPTIFARLLEPPTGLSSHYRYRLVFAWCCHPHMSVCLVTVRGRIAKHFIELSQFTILEMDVPVRIE
jgi:hypothetical protein